MDRFDRFRVGKHQMSIYDHSNSLSSHAICDELLNDCYGVDQLTFQPGDRIVDVGGHVGMFSILMALRWPNVHVTAYEAYPPNYELLLKNIEVNQLDNVSAFNLAITGHGKPITITGINRNSGGASAYTVTANLESHSVSSITLDEAIGDIIPCAFLKMDCEGYEYDILNHFSLWRNVRRLGGEFHINGRLSGLGYSPSTLMDYCHRRTAVTSVKFCQMDE